MKAARLPEPRAGNGLIVASGPNPDNETVYRHVAARSRDVEQLAVEFVQDESLPGLGVARGADRLVITGSKRRCRRARDSVCVWRRRT